MLEGLNSAAAGMAAQQRRIDAVANDLANANTTGYEHVRVGFRDLVYTQTGRSSAQPYDVAIPGDGFIRVKLSDGRQALTRDGSLRVDGAGLAHGLPPLIRPKEIPFTCPSRSTARASAS
jgi:flagellar basal-body rod protein FlgG